MHCFNRLLLFDPLYEEIVTNSSELMIYLGRHVFLELVLPLFFFITVILTFVIDWSWIPISSVDQLRGKSLEQLKKDLYK